MAHPTGGKWTEFISSSTALRETEKQIKDYSCQLHLQLTGNEAHTFYTTLASGERVKSVYKRPATTTIVEISSDDSDDDEIKVVERVDRVVDSGARTDQDIKMLKYVNSDSKTCHADVQIIEDVNSDSKTCHADVQIIEEDPICVLTNAASVMSTRNIVSRIINTKRKSHWCDLCKETYRDDLTVHTNSIIHQFNLNNTNNKKNGGNLNNPNFYIPVNNKGYRMMLAQGWDNRKGLGPDGVGAKYPVKTILKQDRGGLGFAEAVARVTHFAANDPQAVVVPHMRGNKRAAAAGAAGNKKQRKAVLSIDRQREIDIRKQLDNLL